MHRFRVCFFLIAIVLSVGRLAAQQTSTVNVSLLNNTFTHVDLMNAYGNETQKYASADIVNNRFSMTVSLNHDIYRFNFGDTKYFLIVITPGETLELTIDADDLQKVVYTSGSPSMAFVKNTTDLTNRKKFIVDSLNNALKNDSKQQYWSRFAQQFNQFKQTNDDVDNYLLSAYDQLDTLDKLFASLPDNGKLKGENLDVFVKKSNTTLKALDNAYRPFDNYLTNVDKYYNFTSGRISGYEEFFTLLDGYIASVNQRHTLAQASIGKCMPEVKRLIAMRDSLAYNSLLDKGKNKSSWAKEVIESLSLQIKSVRTDQEQYKLLVNNDAEVAQNLITNSQKNVSDIVHIYQTQYNESDSYLNSRLMEAIRSHKEDIAVLMFLDYFPREQNSALHEEVIKALHKVYPGHPIVKERWDYINSPGYRTTVGAMAPELAYPNPDGKIIKLSDLRGKIVILDFWASWCVPCRRESPNVRRIYGQYHDKGVEVFSFSLDRDAASWKKAIADDMLVWPYHASDLKGWKSEGAAAYGVRSIPAVFLLNREGRIVAKNLRGQSLEDAIKQLLNE